MQLFLQVVNCSPVVPDEIAQRTPSCYLAYPSSCSGRTATLSQIMILSPTRDKENPVSVQGALK